MEYWSDGVLELEDWSIGVRVFAVRTGVYQGQPFR